MWRSSFVLFALVWSMRRYSRAVRGLGRTSAHHRNALYVHAFRHPKLPLAAGNHIFCMACLQKWLDEKPACPTCTTELDPRHGAGDLRLASPLAWRVLGRLRLHCPLSGCDWIGEYSELMPHMTSSESHQAGTAVEGAVEGNQASSPSNSSATQVHPRPAMI